MRHSNANQNIAELHSLSIVRTQVTWITNPIDFGNSGASVLFEGVHDGQAGCGKLLVTTNASPETLRNLRCVQVHNIVYGTFIPKYSARKSP